MKIQLPKYATTYLKIALSLACLWYALTKPNWSQLVQVAEQVSPAWVLVALGAYTLSKVLASRRLNINFKLIGLQLTERANRRLFWLGMLYNLLLPGAITGDAYKVMVLGKAPGLSRKSLTLAVLLDRFSGLLSLMLILAILYVLVLPRSWVTFSGLIGAGLLIPFSQQLLKKLLPQQAKGFNRTFWLGAGVQLLVVLTVFSLILSMNLTPDSLKYMLVFLSAAALSVLPISIGGGLGIREFASIQGAQWIGLPIEKALMISLLFYGVTLLTALPGALYIFRDPLTESK